MIHVKPTVLVIDLPWPWPYTGLMNPNDVHIDVFDNGGEWPEAIYTMMAYHQPTGTWIEGNWADGEDTEDHMREQLLDKLADLVSDRVNG